MDFVVDLVSTFAGIALGALSLHVTHYYLNVHGTLEGFTAFAVFYGASKFLTNMFPFSGFLVDAGLLMTMAPVVLRVAEYFRVADQIKT